MQLQVLFWGLCCLQRALLHRVGEPNHRKYPAHMSLLSAYHKLHVGSLLLLLVWCLIQVVWQ